MDVKTKRGKVAFDVQSYQRIIENNNERAVANIFSLAIELAISIKHGQGIINRAMLADSEVEAIEKAMAPLIPVLEREVIMSVGTVFDGMLSNPNLKDYLQRQTAVNIGKNGGRRPRSRLPHLAWLDGAMRQNQLRHPHVSLTAKEHRQRLLSDPDILEDDDGNLAFTDTAIDRLGLGDNVSISDNAIEKALTRIKKHPI